MCECRKSPRFLPMDWTQSDRGITALSWRDDPLHAQIVLPERVYHECFPETKLPWPALGEIILPEEAARAKAVTRVIPEGDTLRLIAQVSNETDAALRIDWIRLALPMDQCFRKNDVFKYEQNVMRHTGLIGCGAYVYWQKPGGRPPVTLLMALKDTEVNRFYVDLRYEQSTWGGHYEGLYALELLDVPVRLEPGRTLTYEFAIATVEDISELHDALYALGGLAVDVVPGMAVPRGETLQVRLDTSRRVEQVYFADDCAPVEALGGQRYMSTAAGAGEKKLIVSYADGGFSRLKFFVTDPVADMLRDHAEHIARHQFETDPEDPCYHGILAWNMTDRRRVNSKHNPFANWMAGGSDEIGLVSGLFLSEKNCYAPVEEEIRVLALHVEDFIEQRLTEQPGDRVHRMVPWFKMFEPWAGRGADDVWRAYNYVHVFNIMFNMYRIARQGSYPFLKEPLHYLRRAGEYAWAMWQYWMFPAGEGATKYGNMGEMTLPLFILPALKKEGLDELYAALEPLVAAKSRYFSTKEYPFGSEMAFDTTAYESVYGYAKMIGDGRIAGRAAAASLSNRARTPVWHKYGVDVRGGGDSNWNVSYMTQLGVFPVSDMLLEGSLTDPEAAVMAHGATLGGFTMYNSGGVWDDAPINRHSSWWVMDERLAQGNQPEGSRPIRRMTGEVGLGYFGALHCMTAYAADHPRMGRIGLGCRYLEDEGGVTILPDAWFGRRLCDLVHGFALRCEGCEIKSVYLSGAQATVALQAQAADAAVYLRGRVCGQWRKQTLIDQTFSFSLDENE